MSNRAEVLAIIKAKHTDALSHAQEVLTDSRQNGQKAARALSDATDTILQSLFTQVYRDKGLEAPGLSFLAVGGYGRRQLAPHSDLDLLFLLPDQVSKEQESLVEDFLYWLWDAGFKVGHAVRTIGDCIRLAQQDISICTSLLECRLLAGDLGLFEQFCSRYHSQILKRQRRFFLDGKLAERSQRHGQEGASRFALEPNVKEGIGGLRDLQTLYWIMKFLRGQIISETASDLRFFEDLRHDKVFDKAQAQSFIKAERFLWALRFHLHDLTKRGEDRLTFDFQPEVAKRMGYTGREGQKGVERFMSHYFVVVRSVGNLTRILLIWLEKSTLSAPRFRLPRYLTRQPKVEDFPLVDGRVSLPDQQWLRNRPLDMLRLFEVAQRHRLSVTAESLSFVMQNLKLINRDFMNNPEANALFMRMLTSRKDPGRTLRRLNDAGVLGRFIPDFGRIVGMMQFDRYHHYTVDEHTLFAIDNLWQLEQGTIAKETPLSTEFMGKIKSRTVLYVAVLLHDIAKGRKGLHEIIGAEVALRLCPRFGLDESQTEMVAWLVRHHLDLSKTITKRDLDDPQTVKDYAELVGTLEYARCLHILTSADIRAVGPGIWNSWKATLMRHMFAQTHAFLRGGLSNQGLDQRSREMRNQVKAHFDKVWERRSDKEQKHLWQLLQAFPDSYWVAHPFYDLVRQVALLVRAAQQATTRLVDVELPGDLTQSPDNPLLDPLSHDEQRLKDDLRLLVSCPDRKGLFASVAGAIALAGGSVEEAKVHTSNQGQALQVYTVKVATHSRATLFDLAAKLKKFVERALANCLHIEQALDAGLQQTSRRLRVFNREVRVSIDNDGADRHTLVEVSANDRPGSLYWMTRTLSDHDLQIHTAKISPLGTRFTDVFYVQGPEGQKVTEPGLLADLKKDLENSLKNLDKAAQRP